MTPTDKPNENYYVKIVILFTFSMCVHIVSLYIYFVYPWTGFEMYVCSSQSWSREIALIFTHSLSTIDRITENFIIQVLLLILHTHFFFFSELLNHFTNLNCFYLLLAACFADYCYCGHKNWMRTSLTNDIIWLRFRFFTVRYFLLRHTRSLVLEGRTRP